MNELALFAGAGGGILGGRLLGWHTVAAVEIEPYPRDVLLQRQRDGLLPHFPLWDDVRTFDGKPWRGIVDVVSGGFPCQDISAAGKGAGIDGERSGLWAEMFRIICEVRPRYAFVENSPMLTGRGLHRVLGDLAEAGYYAAWLVLGADDVGAPHVRKRLWILALDADTDLLQRAELWGPYDRAEELAGCGEVGLESRGEMADADRNGRKTQPHESGESGSPLGKTPEQQPRRANSVCESCGEWWAEPALGRVADGVAHRMDRLKAIGNGQVPIVAAVAFKTLFRHLLENYEKHITLIKK